MHTDNRNVVQRLFAEVISNGNLALADEIVAEGFINHDGRSPPGREAFKMGVMAIRAAFPDWTSTLDDLIVEGDKVGARWTVQGTHQGPFMGMPPTGRRITMKEAGLLRLEGGKLVEIWRVADELAMLQQLGVLPPMGPPPAESR